MKFYKTPGLLRAVLPQLEWKIKTKSKDLFLTFDDGPIPELTPFVLDMLGQFNARATFFCVGDNLRKHPDIGKKILQDGHLIGNHTYNHIDGWKHTTNEYLMNIRKFESIYEKQYKQSAPQLFRPPYGKANFRQINKLKKNGYRIIMWNLLSYDFDKDADHEKALQKIVNNTVGGSIIVFHDNVKAEKGLKKILPTYLKVFSRSGFSFKTLI